MGLGGQGHGDLVTLGQGLTAAGPDMGSWATGSVGGAPGGWAGTVRAGSALGPRQDDRKGIWCLKSVMCLSVSSPEREF